MELKRILCAVDMSDWSPLVLGHATAVARWYDAEVTALHVVPTFDPVVAPPTHLVEPPHVLYPMPREQVLAALKDIVQAEDTTGVHVTCTARAGDPATTIVDEAVGRAANLLVMGTHGRRGFDRFLLGSVAERVVRTAPCPVLTIPPHASTARRGGAAFRQILCPIDYSPSSLQALGFALALARRAHGSLTVLHAIEWLVEEEPVPYERFDAVAYRAHLLAEARSRLEALLDAETTRACRVEQVVLVGRAYPEILHVSSHKQCDLIVMGAQGPSGLGLAMFGSTTSHVLRAATRPVLTVRG